MTWNFMRLQYNYNDSCSANLYLIKIQFLDVRFFDVIKKKKKIESFLALITWGT